MNKPRISIIAAIASGNRALGKDGDLIYKIPEDLKRFKELTSGHPIIMGRKTFESIGRPLANRTNIVLSHKAGKTTEGVYFANSLEIALKIAQEGEPNGEVFIIGGGQIYKEALPKTDRLYLTIVEGNPDADTFFPDYSEFKRVVFEENHKDTTPPFKYLTLER